MWKVYPVDIRPSLVFRLKNFLVLVQYNLKFNQKGLNQKRFHIFQVHFGSLKDAFQNRN